MEYTFYEELLRLFPFENYYCSQTEEYFTIHLDSKVIVKIQREIPYKVYVRGKVAATLIRCEEFPYLTFKKVPGSIYVNTPLIFSDTLSKERKRRKVKPVILSQGIDHFTTLPLELIQFIFRFTPKNLNTLFLVCKSFSQVMNEEFWNSVILGYHKLTDISLRIFWKRRFFGLRLMREVDRKLTTTSIKERVFVFELFATPHNFCYITAKGLIKNKGVVQSEIVVPSNKVVKSFVVWHKKVSILFLDGECILYENTIEYSAENIMDISLDSDLLILVSESFVVTGLNLNTKQVEFEIPLEFKFSSLTICMNKIHVTRKDLNYDVILRVTVTVLKLSKH